MERLGFRKFGGFGPHKSCFRSLHLDPKNAPHQLAMQQQTYTPGFAPEVLPCELERMIFELAVRERQTMGGGILDILLVCNRVREWCVTLRFCFH